MFKTVTIEGKPIPLKSTGRTARMYAQFFNSDFIGDFYSLSKLADGGDIKPNVVEQITWSLAKTANPNIPDIDEWLEQFESSISLFEKFEEIMSVVNSSFKTQVKPKKKKPNQKRK